MPAPSTDGASSSLLPPALRWAGPPLALGYGLGGKIHRALTTPRHAPLPAICIGNITVGGTGKTPATQYFARGLAQRGRKPAVLMRGYKGQASDEAVEVQNALADLKTPVLIGGDRLANARRAKEQGCDCVLLDDGFQHWKLARDLDIVLIDATDPFGGGHLAPWGKLREAPEGLARAGVVIVTRADLVSAERLAEIEKTIAGYAPRAARAKACHKPARLREIGGTTEMPLEKLRGLPVVLLCGIGNPMGFRRTLEQLGARVIEEGVYPDHHVFDNLDLTAWEKGAILDQARIVVVTTKDAAKIECLPNPNPSKRIWSLEVKFSVLEGEQALWEKVDAALNPAAIRAGL